MTTKHFNKGNRISYKGSLLNGGEVVIVDDESYVDQTSGCKCFNPKAKNNGQSSTPPSASSSSALVRTKKTWPPRHNEP